ncbi:MAG TPA: tetratricopeptide repeat protein [Acidobacteriaceae bacterium]|jgi:tetratricopeptide (TPR) repeat protein|nr:tetratricopeptide repeat protein [Acidobacteriaceae bacterium]
MKFSARIVAGSALLVVLLSTTGCTKLRARDQLVKGVQAFKAGEYEQAVNHFQNSIKLDPNYESARLYLATAYSYQVVPNLDTPENLAIAQKALNGFNEVLAKNPNDLGALRQIASIHRNIKQFAQAKADEQKIISLDPKDAEANYTIGVIDWTQSYKNAVQILGEQGLQDDGEGNVKMNKATCAKIKAANTDLVNDAMTYLQQAVNINPNYDDAMSYLNLNYRRKADLDCGDDAARKADLAQADAWVQRAIGARKANEAAKEKKEAGGITLQNNNNQ